MNKQEIIIKRIGEVYHKIYTKNSAGGKLHLVLDDYNYEDESIKFCLKEIKSRKEKWDKQALGNRSWYIECATLLLKLPYNKRHIEWQYI